MLQKILLTSSDVVHSLNPWVSSTLTEKVAPSFQFRHLSTIFFLRQLTNDKGGELVS